VECRWCDRKITNGSTIGFCSNECMNEAKDELETYLEWYNDYMAGYDVPSFEKFSKKPKRQEEA